MRDIINYKQNKGTTMILTAPANIPAMINFDQLDAINIFAYLSSHTQQEVCDGVGANLNEFSVLPEVLALAMFMFYEYNPDVPTSDLQHHLREAGEALTDAMEGEESVSCELTLLYLVLSRFEADLEWGIVNLDEFKKLKLAMVEGYAASQ